jgi:hypothetical protein
MAGFKFVGFQEHVEIPAGFQLLQIQENVISQLDKDQTFALLSQPELMSSWFLNITSLVTKQGGKVTFRNSQGVMCEGICTAVAMGKEIALLSDEFGQFTAKVTSKGNATSVNIQFAILTDSLEIKESQLRGYIENLKAVLL